MCATARGALYEEGGMLSEEFVKEPAAVAETGHVLSVPEAGQETAVVVLNVQETVLVAMAGLSELNKEENDESKYSSSVKKEWNSVVGLKSENAVRNEFNSAVNGWSEFSIVREYNKDVVSKFNRDVASDCKNAAVNELSKTGMNSFNNESANISGNGANAFSKEEKPANVRTIAGITYSVAHFLI